MNPEFAVLGFIIIVGIIFVVFSHLFKTFDKDNVIEDLRLARLTALYDTLREINDAGTVEEAYARIEDMIEDEKDRSETWNKRP